MRTTTILLGAALLLAACDGNTTAGGPQAGGEDFPNAVNGLGRTLAQGMDSTRNWNGLDSASTDVGNGAGGLGDSSAVLARALGLCRDTAFGAQLEGTLAYYQKITCIPGTLLGYAKDSVVLAYRPDMTESDIDTVYWWSVDSVRAGYESYTWIQPYSRSFVLLKGDTGKVKFDVRRTAGRWTDLTEMVADGGRDGKVTTGEDNTYWWATRSLVKNAATTAPDTSWALWIQQGTADRPVIGTSDSGLARVRKYVKLGVGSRVESGLIVAHRDATRNYAQLWSAVTDRTPWGYRRFQAVWGPRPDSSFRARDTVRLLDRFRAVSGNDSTRTDVVAILGPDLIDHSRDSVLSLKYERHRSGLAERHTLFQIQSDDPVPAGGESKSGTVVARLEYANGSIGQFHGRWNAQFFTGTWSNGTDSFSVVVRRDGTVQNATRL